MKRALRHRNRLFATGALLVTALFSCFYLVYRGERQVQEQQKAVLHTHDVLGELASLRLANARAYGRCLGFSATGGSRFLEECERNVGLINTSLGRLRELTTDNGQQQKLLDELIPEEKQYVQSLGDLGALPGPKPGLLAGRGDAVQPPSPAVLALLQRVETNERALLAERSHAAGYNAAKLRKLLWIAGALTFGLVLFSAHATQRELVLQAKIQAGLRQTHELLGRRYEQSQLELDQALDGLHAQIRERQQAELAVLQLNEQLENRVRSRTAELQEANRELEAFTYSVSHDLRAPLRHMDGFSRMLQQALGPAISEESQHALKRIREAARHMMNLVEDLLRLSKIGRQIPHPSSISLAELVESVREEVMVDAASRKIEWRIDALPQIQADPNLLRHVLVNLLANAVKFTRARQLAEIQIGSYARPKEAVIFVKDNGAGFDPHYAEKLFGVFQRLHRQDEFEGTGIGLAIAQRIIRKHGGWIWAEGQLGAGATFFFSLPLRSERTAAAERAGTSA